jgi:transposase-like protein
VNPYPKTLNEFLKAFSEETRCRAYLEKIRWKEGVSCPYCHQTDRIRRISGRFEPECGRCRRQFSVLVGTIFQDSHLPIKTWFYAIWWITNQKSGVSALGLQRALSLGSYRTAWLLLHKLRRAMVSPHQAQLSGEVEVDEVFIGGENNKKLIAVAAEIDGKRTGRIRIKKVKDRSTASLLPFVQGAIEQGSVVVTDGLKSYCEVVNHGYQHRPMKKPYYWEDPSPDHDSLLPRLHRVASLLKRWYYGTLHGKIDPKYLDRYLDEFVFRFNRRMSTYRGLLFLRTLENAVNQKPIKYSDLKQTHKA